MGGVSGGGLLVYWLIGCLIIGVAAGGVMRDCPDHSIAFVDVASAVAVWPWLLWPLLSWGRMSDRKNPSCKKVAQ